MRIMKIIILYMAWVNMIPIIASDYGNMSLILAQ